MSIFGYKGWKHKLTKYKPAEAVEFIVKDLAPMFKAEGYKKIGRTWTKDMGEFSFVISIQACRWNGENTGASFDATYNIYVPRVFKVLNTRPLPKHPKSYDCVFGQSISGDHQPISWDIFDNTDIDALKKIVSAKIKEQCIDAFKDISTLGDVKAKLLNGIFTFGHHREIGLAVLCAEMGDMVNAKHYFNQTINDMIRPEAYRDSYKNIARKYITVT